MRAFVLALVLILDAAVAAGFPVEEETLFPSAEPELRVLSILSTTDTSVLQPLIADFQSREPGVAVRYTVANSQAVFSAIHDEGLAFDLVISSAMDLQMKLANDGFAASYGSGPTAQLPAWAHWQNRLFAFAQENVVLIASRSGFGGLPLPQTRRDLIEVLRDNPDRFRGRIGTYNPELSGAGYLFATQDARQSDSFWRLAEVMGGLAPRLYTTSNEMITDLKQGQLVLAYNVLGSYAEPRLDGDPDAEVIELEDYTLTLLRTGLIPVSARAPDLGGRFLDFLLGPDGQRLLRDKAGLPPIDEVALSRGPHLRPMRLEPGLLVFLDRLKRRGFLDEWTAALSRN
ncbi:ABC transporter substrate-binding protein [Defluviimonas sp. SAOS-178_SWC]|uniref:ABC transporter substrate-binding protein n=1 Tax=Defluviimonas sp. SAOS-178_SWC TaxID=3121287 RepID=UPI0032217FDE